MALVGTGEFAGAGGSPGLQIWRIEKMVPVFQDPDTYGKFYSGDSYICLNTRAVNNSYEYDLHFWLGKETSQDEMGACAYKTVELDDMLGGAPVQYREVQGHESDMFMSMFKGGVQYLDGGVESGFNKVDLDAFDPRLLHLKGRRKVRVSQVPVTRASMNHGDVFILDLGWTIFQWNGNSASRLEKSKALEMTSNIRDNERGAKATVIIMEDGNEGDACDSDEQEDMFWDALGGRGPIMSAEEAGGDDAAEKSTNFTLYRLSDESGSMQTTEVGSTPLSRDLLDSNDAFVLDAETEIFVWIGKNATKDERRQAMQHAQDFLVKHNRPNYTPITRVAESGETPLFKDKFVDWAAQEAAAMQNFAAVGGGNVARVEDKGVDISAMHTRQQQESERMVDDGTGKLTCWRIEDFAKVKVDDALVGQFYMGDSYIILYEYTGSSGKDEALIYFWLGDYSSQDEQGAAALLAKELDDEMGGDPVQVRVTQGKEPNHFLTLFKGRMIIHEGGRASGFKNANDVDSYDTDGISLFHVRGTTPLNTMALQVAEVTASLNTNDCFVLETPETQYVWFGKGASDSEKETARNIAKILQYKRSVVEIEEGNEPAEFWTPLGGPGEYANFPHLKDVPQEPRLFQCSNASGAFTVEEIFNFEQDDLDNDDVMILDTYVEVFVWIGKDANTHERKRAMETAVEYVDNANDGRDANIPILLVQAGAEPMIFTCHFHGWDPNKHVNDDAAYEALLAQARANNPGEDDEADFGEYAGGDNSASQSRAMLEIAAARAGKVGAHSAPTAGGGAASGDVRAALADFNRTYTYAELTADPRPANADPTQLEQYLSDAEFNEVFGMSKDAFNGTANWKKVNLKKKAGLF